jgi:hypothetical protein
VIGQIHSTGEVDFAAFDWLVEPEAYGAADLEGNVS